MTIPKTITTLAIIVVTLALFGAASAPQPAQWTKPPSSSWDINEPLTPAA